jgi:fatty-acyl-CoA synthase
VTVARISYPFYLVLVCHHRTGNLAGLAANPRLSYTLKGQEGPRKMTESTVTGLLLARAGDNNPGLRFGDREWSWAEHVSECARYAAVLAALRQPGPFHVGVLADNGPSFSFLLGAAALSGAVLVGLNPERRGAALARDVRLADCQLVLAEHRHAGLLAGADLGAAAGRVLLLDSPDWSRLLASQGSPAPDPVPAGPDDLLMLIFTSGTSGEPKAVRCTHAKIAFPGVMLAGRFGLSGRDCVYVSMPMFHSNAIMAGWAVGLAAGATLALRHRFSASGFLPDVRAFGATYANYVGKPLCYVLATPPRPDDASNPLRVMYGNEAAPADVAAFAKRFGCAVIDGYGSTEGGIGIARDPDAPPAALGRLPDGVAVLDPDTGARCPEARFDSGGRLVNAGEAVGELVSTSGGGMFAGYYNDPGADGQRLRGGMYWSGDLGYVDEMGFCYFAGRSGDWLRVDGENLGTAPIERVLLRHRGVAEAAVYAVPDTAVGDQVMAAIVARAGVALEAGGLGAFLASQADLGPRQWPRFVRVTTAMPRTATFKVLKRALAAERWDCGDPVWWRPGREQEFRLLTAADATGLNAALRRRNAGPA